MRKILIFLIILCCTPLGYFFGPSTMKVDAKQPAKNPITVKLVSEQVDPQDTGQALVGNSCVNYLGTLLLNSPHPAFGGFSDILISSDRKTVLAVSDLGFWLKTELNYTPEGFLSGTAETAQLGQLLDTEGKAYPIKFKADAEGLSHAPGNGYLVSFERIHRIDKFSNGTQLSLAGKAENFPIPKTAESLPDNCGLESILLLPNQNLFILAEGKDEKDSISYGAIFDNKSWTEFNYQRSDDFRPTSAGNLPDNEILVLERRYTGPGSLGIRFRKFPADKISAGAIISAENFFEISPPLPRDNFEGLDTVTTADGTTYIYIISDDNFSPVQHTLLSLFELLPRSEK